MTPANYLIELNVQLSHLYSFARQTNELDFAASLGGEFRGLQDAGWATTITANEVFDELRGLSQQRGPLSRARMRVMLMLYCQLAEAGGFYETLKNLMGIVTLKPYLLWPFKDLVRVRQTPKRVIGPNANATFRDLASAASNIGLTRLSSLLESAFRDDIRNGISHADYVIWSDGLRLRKRNGGNPDLVSFDHVYEALEQGAGFFQILREYNAASVRSFDPPKTIVGRLSANFPMPWTVSFDPKLGSLGISGSSPGPVSSPEYERQIRINGLLGGRVMATYTTEPTAETESVYAYIVSKGFEPNDVRLDEQAWVALIDDIDKLNLWDGRRSDDGGGTVLLTTPWGFRRISSPADLDSVLGEPLIKLTVTESQVAAEDNGAPSAEHSTVST